MEETYIIEDAHLLALAAEADQIVSEEVQGRNPDWPTNAAIAYAEMADTCRRFVSLPHAP